MDTHSPNAPAYPLPSGRAISAAGHGALDAHHKALDRLGRVMAVVTAAAMRDILTNNDQARDAPFDAAYAELAAGADGSLWATGRYWTTAGEERHLATTPGVENAETGLFGMNEWVPYLNDDNHDVWKWLVTDLPDVNGRPAYRFNLTQAAALPLD